MNKLKLDLPLVLPHDAEQADPCVHRLLIAVRGRPGVIDAHIDTTPDAQSPRLCVHFDAKAIAPSEVEKLVHAAGAELADHYGHLRVSVRGVRHERHARVIEAALLRERGVLYAAVNFGTRRAAIEFDPRQLSEQQALECLKRAGLQPGDLHEGHSHAPGEHDHAQGPGEHAGHKHGPGEHEGHKHGPGEHAHGGPFGERSELVFSVLCGVLTGAGWLLEGMAPPAVSMVLYALAYLFGGYFTVREAYEAIRAGRFEIDFLMLVAAGGAAALGEFAEGALLLFLFSFGHGLEGYAMSRARKAIAGLTELVPATAVKLTAGGEAVVPIAELAIGDRLVIKPNTRIPADGVVARGESSVDQAPITGESVPVDKRPHADPAATLAEPTRIDPAHRVFAGTINGPGALEVLVTRIAADSTLARVVKLVTEAETQKSPTQQFTDRFERVFVPVILGLVVLLLFAWVILPEPFSASFYRAMAVLVAASPCALAIATPSAVLAGVARAARGGVLVKGGAHLEALGSVGAIAFDKTGTLTEGKPRLTDVRPVQGVDVAQLLSVAGALERRSDHPLARAVVESAEARLAVLPDATDVTAITGFGLRGRIDGATVRIGKPGLFTGDGGVLPPPIQSLVTEVEGMGRTVMLVEFGGTFYGLLGVMDTPRPSARPVLERLRQLGIGKTIMLTGDNQRVADAVAREVGITEARGDLLPEQKVEAVAQLARSSSQVAMVGDGVNDAPALASATVGIAMGAGGSDVALETADVALMSDDLHGLPFAVGLSRSCRRVIRQNLWASLGMVAFLIPATLFGFAGIGAAVALHEGSTLVVVANALRLLAYRDPRTKH